MNYKKKVIDKETESRFLTVRNRMITAVQNELERGDVTDWEMLAILAHATGVCIALQDQNKMTPDLAIKIVQANIEAGNREVLNGLDPDMTKEN